MCRIVLHLKIVEIEPCHIDFEFNQAHVDDSLVLNCIKLQ